MTTELTWTGSPDDQTAVCGEYVLRVLKLGFIRWWSFSNRDNAHITSGFIWFDTDQAKTAAIAAMNEHLKKNL